jgi:glycosyltransferase involved in cell wall biosynthesis
MASSTVANRPLRVLCCSGSLEGGGSERQLWQLASKLDRQRFSSSVYLLYRRGHYIEQLPDDVGVTAFWSEFDESQRFWPGQIRRMQIGHLAKVIRDLKIDVVYDRTFHMTLVTAAAATRARVPRVSVIVSPPSADFQKSREGFRYFKKRLLAAAYRQAGCVTIAVSEEVADDAAAFYGVNRSLIQVLQNPVDLELVQALAQRTDASCASVAPGLRIVVVGRLSREKGQRLALQALQVASARSDKHMHLDIVGDGPDRAVLEQIAARLGILENVTFHGFVANPYSMIQKSHLLCIPSEYEGLPNVALEAMALGTTVVATDCSGSLRTLIGNNERGLLVPQGDVGALAQVFAEDDLESSEFERRRTLASQWIAQHHGLPAWLRDMETTLSTVVKPPFGKFNLELD